MRYLTSVSCSMFLARQDLEVIPNWPIHAKMSLTGQLDNVMHATIFLSEIAGRSPVRLVRPTEQKKCSRKSVGPVKKCRPYMTSV